MVKIVLILAAILSCGSITGALAQQQQSPEEQIQFLSRAVSVLQQQRNAAEDSAAQAAARAAGIQAQLDEVQKQYDALKKVDAKQATPSVNVVGPPKP